jgi:hypothetical protein
MGNGGRERKRVLLLFFVEPWSHFGAIVDTRASRRRAVKECGIFI